MNFTMRQPNAYAHVLDFIPPQMLPRHESLPLSLSLSLSFVFVFAFARHLQIAIASHRGKLNRTPSIDIRKAENEKTGEA